MNNYYYCMDMYGLYGKKVTDILKEKRFTLSVELVPLRNGQSYAQVFSNIDALSKLEVDFISVTKGAGGSLRGGTLPLSYFIREKFGVNSIAHLTCGEYSKQEIENELVDHHLLGVKNILALRGDPPTEKHGEKFNGDYGFAWEFAKQIKSMNSGSYLERNGKENLGEKTDFCIGVAAYPEGDLEKEVEYLAKKVEEGAEYAITQMLFDAEVYVKFVGACRARGVDIPIIPGIRPLTKYSQCEFTEKFFKLPVPKELKRELKNEDKEIARKAGIKYAIALCKELRGAGAPGAHFFVINDVEAAKEIISSLNGTEEAIVRTGIQQRLE